MSQFYGSPTQSSFRPHSHPSKTAHCCTCDSKVGPGATVRPQLYAPQMDRESESEVSMCNKTGSLTLKDSHWLRGDSNGKMELLLDGSDGYTSQSRRSEAAHCGCWLVGSYEYEARCCRVSDSYLVRCLFDYMRLHHVVIS